jgi:hypothetical protein
MTLTTFCCCWNPSGSFLSSSSSLFLLILRSVWQRRLERLAYDQALEHRVVALGVDWAPLVVQDLIELILRFFCLLTTRGAILSADSVIWHAFACRIPLVAGPSTFVVGLPIVVVVTPWEAAALLFLFVCPMHLTYLCI